MKIKLVVTMRARAAVAKNIKSAAELQLDPLSSRCSLYRRGRGTSVGRQRSDRER
jgi:hypothetical protein